MSRSEKSGPAYGGHDKGKLDTSIPKSPATDESAALRSHQLDMLWPDIPFRAIVEQSLVGIYVLQDECFQYANVTFAGMTGYTPQEMIGGHLSKFIVPEFFDEVMTLYHKRISGELPSVRFVTRLVHKHGAEIKIEVHGSRMFYRGRPAVVGVGIDVTERSRRDEELRQSRTQLQELAAHINTVR